MVLSVVMAALCAAGATLLGLDPGRGWAPPGVADLAVTGWWGLGLGAAVVTLLSSVAALRPDASGHPRPERVTPEEQERRAVEQAWRALDDDLDPTTAPEDSTTAPEGERRTS